MLVEKTIKQIMCGHYSQDHIQTRSTANDNPDHTKQQC